MVEELQFQLTQLTQALEVPEEGDKPSIEALIKDLEEIIKSLSEENQSSTQESDTSLSINNQEGIQKCEEDDEYLKFKAELKDLEKEENVDNETSFKEKTEDSALNSIERELDALIGMKCKAPHEHHWGQLGFYNAIIFSVEPTTEISNQDEISVRVIYTQPVSKKMLPCPYYLKETCSYENNCKFSHGEVVLLSSLKEYKDPDFSKLVSGSRVLAKYTDDLWYSAVVSEILESGNCELTYENYKEKAIVPLHDTLPLEDEENYAENSASLSSDDSDSESSEEGDIEKPQSSNTIMWVHMRGTSALGKWEQHTKGIGSKLMAKMGYVFGCGLGKEGEGRVEPVDAVIVPSGRSLDTIMMLKEKAGCSGENLFSVERHLARLQKKEKIRTENREKKERERENVFKFLNTSLNLKKDKERSSSQATVSKDTAEDLSKKLVSIGESIRQANREIIKTKDGIKRQEGRDKLAQDTMKVKLKEQEDNLDHLKKLESKISNEQKHRSDKKKLTIF